MQAGTIADIHGARVLGLFGDSITTDHISPAGDIKEDVAGGPIPAWRTACQPADFNSYGSRRGNDDVMVRGTFANIRIKNLMLDGVEGGNTLHVPSGEQLPIYDAAMKYKARKTSAGRRRRQGIRHRFVARLGGQRHAAARREGRDRRKLRAHPSLQPGRHGRVAAAVQRRRERAESLGLTGKETFDDRRPRRRRREGSRRWSRKATTAARSVQGEGAAADARRNASTSVTAASCPTCCASWRQESA